MTAKKQRSKQSRRTRVGARSFHRTGAAGHVAHSTVILASPRDVVRAVLDNPELQGMTVTVCFDPGESGLPYATAVRFLGRREPSIDAPDGLHRTESFVQEERIDRVVPGCGQVSVTARIYGIAPGEWNVSAELVGEQRLTAHPNRRVEQPRRSSRIHLARWSWLRWSLVDASSSKVRSQSALRARIIPAPAVIPGSWTGLVIVGVVAGFFIQSNLINEAHLSNSGLALASALTILSGAVGAKLWFRAQPATARQVAGGSGWCVQGAVVGGAIAMVTTLLILKIPVGLVVGATTPALLIGMGLGRVGCFFTGCCTGRVTASRWGIWSSDQRVGARRIPTQLIEASLALVIGFTTWFVVEHRTSALSIALLMVAFSIYTLLRQLVLRLRTGPRKATHRTMFTVVTCSAAIVLAIFCWIADTPWLTALCRPLVTHAGFAL